MMVAKRPFYSASEVAYILNVGKTKAYEIISTLTKEVEAKGFSTPKQGVIQKKILADRYMMTVKECDEILQTYKKDNKSALKGQVAV